jgi:hypothetical protein
MTDRWYSVGIETEGTGPRGHEADLERLLGVLVDDVAIAGPAASWGGTAGGPSATVSVRAGGPAEAADRALARFEAALDRAGIPSAPVAWVEVMTQEHLVRELEQERSPLVGLAEVAEVLGVSKQRVSELRDREDFPRPVAELRSGPVWRLVNLQTFIGAWDRRPGRPPRGADVGKVGG